MKKSITCLVLSVALLSSCGTYTGQGAYVGGSFGSVLGSAIGGISGGWRGHHVGQIIGMAGGAAVGAAIGAAADQKQAERMDEYRRQRTKERISDYDNRSDDSGFDETNSADDRIDFDGAGPRKNQGNYTVATPKTVTLQKGEEPGYSVHYNSLIEIRNARIIDANQDGILKAGEECQVTFEVMNNSSKPLFDIQPTVIDVTGNKHIHVSPNLHVESIAPNSGIRYTATILAGKKLKDGTVVIRVGVTQGNREITSQMKEFYVQTRRK